MDKQYLIEEIQRKQAMINKAKTKEEKEDIEIQIQAMKRDLYKK